MVHQQITLVKKNICIIFLINNVCTHMYHRRSKYNFIHQQRSSLHIPLHFLGKLNLALGLLPKIIHSSFSIINTVPFFLTNLFSYSPLILLFTEKWRNWLLNPIHRSLYPTSLFRILFAWLFCGGLRSSHLCYFFLMGYVRKIQYMYLFV